MTMLFDVRILLVFQTRRIDGSLGIEGVKSSVVGKSRIVLSKEVTRECRWPSRAAIAWSVVGRPLIKASEFIFSKACRRIELTWTRGKVRLPWAAEVSRLCRLVQVR